MVAKDKLQISKLNGTGIRALILENRNNISFVTGILEHIGHLPSDFDGECLGELLNSDSSTIRYLAVKNIGKLKNDAFLVPLAKIAKDDPDTNVRREAVSAIGRMRKPDTKQTLLAELNDPDPKVVCQAIRGLLVFRGDKPVDEKLKSLINHPNEMIHQVIEKEYYPIHTYPQQRSHTESFDYLKNVAVNGDTIEIMKLLQDESVHLTFTSPPYYNARDYSIYPSYKFYLEFLRDVFQEVYRITKEGRFLLLNTSPVIVPRVSRAHSSKRYPIPFDIHHYLIEMGWEFIDDIVWEKPEASVKNRVGGFQQHRKPLAYKPNAVTEYVMVYRKRTEKLLDWNIHQYPDEIVAESKVPNGFETTNVWKIDPCFDRVHSAVFPQELCKRVIQYYSYKGDLVFDPFGGSGTMAKTARSLHRYFFTTEKNTTYFNYIKQNLTSELEDEYPPRFFTTDEFKEVLNDADK
jgi:DNA modification methylase